MQLTFLIQFKDLGRPDNYIEHKKNKIEVEKI